MMYIHAAFIHGNATQDIILTTLFFETNFLATFTYFPKIYVRILGYLHTFPRLHLRSTQDLNNTDLLLHYYKGRSMYGGDGITHRYSKHR